jgi:hypothetical protein
MNVTDHVNFATHSGERLTFRQPRIFVPLVFCDRVRLIHLISLVLVEKSGRQL